jgi:hypothetical protein
VVMPAARMYDATSTARANTHIRHVDRVLYCMLGAHQRVCRMRSAVYSSSHCRGLYELHRIQKDVALEWFAARREVDGITSSTQKRVGRTKREQDRNFDVRLHMGRALAHIGAWFATPCIQRCSALVERA